MKVVVTVKNKGEITVEKDESYSRSTTTEEDSAGGRRNVEEEAGRSETVMKDGKEPFVVKETGARGTGGTDSCTGRRLFSGPGEIDQFCRGIAESIRIKNSSCTLSGVRRSSFYA